MGSFSLPQALGGGGRGCLLSERLAGCGLMYMGAYALGGGGGGPLSKRLAGCGLI